MAKSTNPKPDIAVIIYTYNRTDDAKINQEIIRNLWAKSGLFDQIKIIHTYNGQTSWWPKKYLEDVLVRRQNSSHYAGAADLMDEGFKAARKLYPKIKYGIVLASDTWLLKPKVVADWISAMAQKELYLASTPWGHPGRNEFADVGGSTDLFIVDLPWADKYHMLPLHYDDFYKKYAELSYYQRGSNISVEKLFIGRFVNAIHRQTNVNGGLRELAMSKLFNIKDRESIHKNDKWERKDYWPTIGLATHHDPAPKQRILRQYKIAGAHIKKLQTAKNLDYFNQH